jgi:hypothetical protein
MNKEVMACLQRAIEFNDLIVEGLQLRGIDASSIEMFQGYKINEEAAEAAKNTYVKCINSAEFKECADLQNYLIACVHPEVQELMDILLSKCETNKDFNLYNLSLRFWFYYQLCRKDGFHTLTLDPYQCEQLVNTELAFGVRDFVAGFPTMIIPIPEDYKLKRALDGVFLPDCVFVNHDPKKGYIQAGCAEKSDKITLFYNFCFIDCPELINLEKYLQAQNNYHERIGMKDFRGYADAFRIAFNALMVSVSKDFMKPLPAKVVDKYRKERVHIKASLPKHGAGVAFSYQGLQLGLKTETPETIPGSAICHEGTGKRVKYHQREGHWRRTRYGVGRALYRWDWIAAYEVNKDLKVVDLVVTSHELNHAI